MSGGDPSDYRSPKVLRRSARSCKHRGTIAGGGHDSNRFSMLGESMDKQQIMTLVACSVGAGLLLEFIKRLIEEVNQGPNKITAVGVIKLMISILQGAIAGAAIAFAPVYLWCSEPQSKSSGRLADDAIRILGGTGEYMPTEKGW